MPGYILKEAGERMKFRAAAAALLLLVLCSCGNQKETERYDSTIFAMDTVMELTAFGEHAKEAISAAENEITGVDALMSATRQGSDIYLINTASPDAAEISAETAQLLKKAEEISIRTEGAFDITVSAAVRAWGFLGGEHRVLTEEESNDLIKNIDYRMVKTEGLSASVPEGFAIDLGGIAKGFASQKALKAISDAGVKSAMLSLGGSVQLLGERPGADKWTIGIRDPFNTDNIALTISVDECAVVTSGDYQRYFTGDDGKRYHHIMDPSTARPAESGLVSVSIISDDAVLADGLSTALFVMGEKKAAKLYSDSDDFEMILIDSAKNVYISEGLWNSFSKWKDNDTEYNFIKVKR